MKIISAKFMKGMTIDALPLEETKPQYAFVGRSNVGKSSLLNALTGSRIARTSTFAGRTQEINMYLLNGKFYFADLPGYGFARTSGLGKEKIGDLIEAYLFDKKTSLRKVILVIDANVGFTDKDLGMFQDLFDNRRDVIIAASKIDKMNQSELHSKINAIKNVADGFPVIPFSSKSKKGISELLSEIGKA